MGTERNDITASWTRRIDRGDTIYSLTVSDSTGQSVSEDFNQSEIRNRLLPFRITRLWGNLLEKRSHIELNKLLKMGQE